MHIDGLLVWIRGPSGLPLTYGRAATGAISLAAPAAISLAASRSPSCTGSAPSGDQFGHLQAGQFGPLCDQFGYLQPDHLARPVTRIPGLDGNFDRGAVSVRGARRAPLAWISTDAN